MTVDFDTLEAAMLQAAEAGDAALLDALADLADADETADADAD